MDSSPIDRIEFVEGPFAPADLTAVRLVRVAYLSPESYLETAWTQTVHPVAAIIHGDFPLPERPWPQIRSQLRPMTGSSKVEILYTGAQVRFDYDEPGVEIAFTEDLFFAGFQLEGDDSTPLVVQAELLYKRLLGLIQQRGYPHLLRVWNVIRDIHGEQDGLERYRQFCIGRYEAFRSYSADIGAAYPAASCVGSQTGGLCVYFLAGKAPGLTVENPNQVSAFLYPQQYGPRSPSFSRSLVTKWGHRANLFVSGTASITGHESRHAGQLKQQVQETLRNIENLVQAAEDRSRLYFPIAGANAVFKAYIRNTSDYPEVRDLLIKYFGPDIEILYLQADICREVLLAEIDGTLTTETAGAEFAGVRG